MDLQFLKKGAKIQEWSSKGNYFNKPKVKGLTPNA
jgi:hypothetical protein